MPDIVTTDVEENVFTITLDDPERGNPLSRATDAAIAEALDDARETDARCIVLQGAGNAFSSGADIGNLGDDGADQPLDEQFETIQSYEHGVVERLIEHPLPTISKIDGAAIGDGACFGLACDIPLASERARIGFSHVRFGLSMDCAASYLLPRLVGRGMAMELALTGRIVDGQRARELGLVNHVFPDETFEERADEIVEEIASGPPIALKHIKRLVRRGFDDDLEGVLANEASSQVIASDSEDYARAAEALRNGEKPEFEGR